MITDAALGALAWLGRQGTRAIAAVVFLGIAVPPLDALLKPFVAEAIFVLLCIAFLRVDLAALRTYLAGPKLPLLSAALTMLVLPAALGFGCLAVGLPERSPDLFAALILQSVAPPMMAAPAFAAVMGLDATLVLVTLVVSMAVTPITAPVFARLFIGPTLTIPAITLGLRLFAMLAGSLLAAAVLRRVMGAERIMRRKAELDGLNIVVVFVFVAAVMEHVAARVATDPMLMTKLALLAFAANAVVLALVSVALAGVAGRERGFALGMMASQRNMGLMLAAAGGSLSDLAWLYFALSQFPIYLAPLLLQPIARRLRPRPV